MEKEREKKALEAKKRSRLRGVKSSVVDPSKVENADGAQPSAVDGAAEG